MSKVYINDKSIQNQYLSKTNKRRSSRTRLLRIKHICYNKELVILTMTKINSVERKNM